MGRTQYSKVVWKMIMISFGYMRIHTYTCPVLLIVALFFFSGTGDSLQQAFVLHIFAV